MNKKEKREQSIENRHIIEARNLHKVYAQGKTRVEALRGIDLKVKNGQSILIVGPSGAGKSTLLHIIGGLDTPTIGTVMLDGDDLYALSDRKKAKARNKKIGFIFQFYHLLSEFTVLENVMLPAMISGLRDEKRARELLELVGLSHRQGHRPRELSGGETQRVAIARSLMNDPGILLCDEPTGNLDSQKGTRIFEILLKLNKDDGKTLIVVSHDERMREDFNGVYYISDGGMERDKEYARWV